MKNTIFPHRRGKALWMLHYACTEGARFILEGVELLFNKLQPCASKSKTFVLSNAFESSITIKSIRYGLERVKNDKMFHGAVLQKIDFDCVRFSKRMEFFTIKAWHEKHSIQMHSLKNNDNKVMRWFILGLWDRTVVQTDPKIKTQKASVFLVFLSDPNDIENLVWTRILS